MKNLFSFGIALVAMLCLTSCNSIPEERSVTANNVEISGFSSKYLKVVDGNYKFTQNGDDASITVKFKLVEKPKEKVCKGEVYAKLRINAVDDSENILDTGYYGFEAGADKVVELINEGVIGDTKSVSFTWKYFDRSKEQAKPIFKKASTFEVVDKSSVVFCSEKEEQNSNAVEEKVSVSSVNKEEKSDNNEWDKALDSYEEYIDSYISFMKKSQAGDMSAMGEYMKMLEKIETFSKKFDKAGNDLTARQLTRFNNLQLKLIESTQNLE
ncbi:hypothetical protein KRX57_10160 [Weeksellaceae bacterium TAE3-ERU29]|nr:hypothetical protein [Weeksellaceae bacterium TAE3-ERU29]